MAKTAVQMIASALAKQHKLSAADASAFVDAFFSIISSELKKGRQVKVKGLGTFKVQSVKPRESVNVNTGERVLIKGHDKITFTPDGAMKELVNKPFSQFETVVINDGVNTEELERIPTDETPDDANTDFTDDLPTESKGSVDEAEHIAEKAEDVEIAPAEPVREKQEDTPAVDEKIAVGIESDEISSNKAVVNEETPVEAGKEESLVLRNESLTRIKDKEEAQEVAAKKNEESVTLDTQTMQTAVPADSSRQDTSEADSSVEEEHPVLSEPSGVLNDEGNDIDSSANGMLRRVAFIAVTVIVFLGVFLWLRFGGTTPREDTTVIVEQTDTSEEKTALASKTVPDDTVTTVSKSRQHSPGREKEEVDSFAAMNNDPRIRYGAYNIVGIDRVVVLKKGQTMEKYSRKTLGADMVGYFQVLNGRKTMQAGDTMKVPKVVLRPEYRK